MSTSAKPRPFFLKKRFLLPGITALLAALGLKNAETIVAIGDAAYTAAQGHAPRSH